MIAVVKSIIVNVLIALYTPFWFAIILTVFVMFFIMSAEESGYKEYCQGWIRKFRTEGQFRLTFLLIFYTIMILFQTLLNRHMYTNPVSNVLGV